MLSRALRERLRLLGQALDQTQQLRVFDGGVVGFNHETEHEVFENGTGKEAGSSARPRPGQRAQPRQQRPRRGEWWWPPRAPGSLGTYDDVEWVGGLGSLVTAYPDTRVAIHHDHVWLAVPARPMGFNGPPALFVICYPRDLRLKVRGWGFWVHGGWLAPMGTRHTNYPDQSICAFPDDGTWNRRFGLTALVDRYSEWAVRQLHFHAFGRWAGMQVGPNALYRLVEFRDGERCHCNRGATYGTCCRPKDDDSFSRHPEAEILALITFTGGVPLGQQATPAVVYRIGNGDYPPANWSSKVISLEEKRSIAAKLNDRRWRFHYRANASVSLKALFT